MEQLLDDFYQTLGLTYLPTDDTPVVVVDESLVCYFIERADGWRLMTPLGPLNASTPLLEALLCANYEEGNRVTMAASRSAQCLLAYLDVDRGEGLPGLRSAFDALLAQAREWQHALAHQPAPDHQAQRMPAFPDTVR